MDHSKCNSSIKCTVSSCAYHAPQNCCSLNQIQVGCTDHKPCSFRNRKRRFFIGSKGRRQSPQLRSSID